MCIRDRYGNDPVAALELAQEHAWLMASEIRATGVDLSFAPVVDLGRGNRAIGDRAFSADPEVVAEIELDSADDHFAMPEWAGREATDAPRYYNLALASRPYSQWSEAEQKASDLKE